MTLLSIIIPVYNVEKYLSKCLDSVLFRDISEYEVIAVNDGSTDSSQQILQATAEKFPDILKVYSQENKGLGEARNTGLCHATGEYVVFLDSDDFYASGAVTEMLAECRKGNDITFFDFLSINGNGEPVGHLKGCSASEGEIFTLEQNPGILFELPSSTNKIIRRSLFTDHCISFPGRVWFEDFRTTPKLYPYAKRITYVPKEWYVYLQQSNSITHGTNTGRNLEIIDAAEDLLEFYKKIGLYEKYNAELEYAMYYNVFLTSVDRVNLIDPKSDVQNQLIDYYLQKFPDFRKNRYFRNQSKKYKLIHFLIINRMFRSLNLLLKANNLIKGK